MEPFTDTIVMEGQLVRHPAGTVTDLVRVLLPALAELSWMV